MVYYHLFAIESEDKNSNANGIGYNLENSFRESYQLVCNVSQREVNITKQDAYQETFCLDIGASA